MAWQDPLGLWLAWSSQPGSTLLVLLPPWVGGAAVQQVSKSGWVVGVEVGLPAPSSCAWV